LNKKATHDKKTEKPFFLHYPYNISLIILIFEGEMKSEYPSYSKIIFKYLL